MKKNNSYVKIGKKSIVYQKPSYLVDAGSHHPENSTDDREASLTRTPECTLKNHQNISPEASDR